MKIKMQSLLSGLALLAGINLTRAQGTAFTYQGRLNAGSTPANGSYDLTFEVYDAAALGTRVGGPLANSATAVSNGLFVVTLEFGAGVFPGAARWLQITVRTNGAGGFSTLSPRQALAATPYAITASNLTGTLPAAQLSGALPSAQLSGIYSSAVTLNNAANSFTGNGAGLSSVNAATLGGLGPGSFWNLLGNGGTTAGINFVGTTDNQPLELKVNNQRALRLEYATDGFSAYPNVIGGINNTILSFGGTIAGGEANRIRTNAFLATIGGGIHNTIEADAYYGMIGGGYFNFIQAGANASAIGGGQANTVSTNATTSVIGGGFQNSILTPAVPVWSTDSSAIGGGSDNIISNAAQSVIAGGGGNSIFSVGQASIGGGGGNSIQEAGQATIGGGYYNVVQTNAYYSTIAGGRNNTIQSNANHSIIGGGYNNKIQASVVEGTISGGGGNLIQSDATLATISGGGNNIVQPNAYYAALGGGLLNLASGPYGAVPGGDQNTAGPSSFAAGHRAKATHTGAFVWADSTEADFGTSGQNQFLIRASGGVGIGTANPQGALHVAGDTLITGVTQLGSGTGNAEAPDKGLILRRAKSTTSAVASVVARTDKLTLERDGTSGGWRIVNLSSPGNTTIAATGLTSAGATVNFVTSIAGGAGAGTNSVFSNAQNVIAFRCSFGDNVGPNHMTEVSLSRYPGDFFWTGTITSTFNQ